MKSFIASGCGLDSNSLSLVIFLKEIFEKVDFEKKKKMAKRHAK